MKRYISILIIISSLLSLGGCGGIHTNYREIQQLMVVQTLGLDREEGSVRVSMAAAAEASGDGPRRMSASGGTVSSAIERAYELSYEEEIFFSHVNHILIGETAAEEELDSFLDYLCQSPELRMDIPLYIVREGTAEQAVMEVGDSSRGISEVMQAVREIFSTASNSRVFTVADTLRSLDRYGSALVCAIRCEPGSESSGPQNSGQSGGEAGGDSGDTEAEEKQAAQEKLSQAAGEEEAAGQEEQGQSGEEARRSQGSEEAQQSREEPGEGGSQQSQKEADTPLMAGIAGYGIIRDGKLCKYLEPELSVAVGLMTDSVPISFISVEDMDGSLCSLEVFQGSAKLSPVWSGPGELIGLDIQAEVTASVMESGPSEAAGAEEYINYLTGQLESAVSEQLNALLQSSMQLKADFLGLAGMVERSSPENYRLMEQSFTEALPKLELQISVSGRLSHTNDMKEA